MYIFMALFVGVLVIISMIINSKLSQKVGVFQGTFINYVVGLFFSVLIIIINKDIFLFSFHTLNKLPAWAFLGGFIGVAVVALSNIVIPKIPTIYTTLLIFLGQIMIGLILDYFSADTISVGKIVGGVLVVTGLGFNMLIDKKERYF